MPPRLKSTLPILSVRDLPKSIDYYRQVLGFELAWTYGTPPDIASVCRDEVEFMLFVERKGPFHVSRVYVHVDDLDTYYAAIVAAGARVTYPLQDRTYGMRDCRIEDIDGNELSFGAPVET